MNLLLRHKAGDRDDKTVHLDRFTTKLGRDTLHLCTLLVEPSNEYNIIVIVKKKICYINLKCRNTLLLLLLLYLFIIALVKKNFTQDASSVINFKQRYDEYFF